MQTILLSADNFTKVGGSQFDSRKYDQKYYAEFSIQPSSTHRAASGNAPIFLNDANLFIQVDMDSDTAGSTFITDIGFNQVSSGDVMVIPIQLAHGRRTHKNEGHWAIYSLWDDDAKAANSGLLAISLAFQGNEGVGDGSRNDLMKTAMAFKPGSTFAASNAGDFIDIPWENFNLRLVYGTNDSNEGGTGWSAVVTDVSTSQVFSNGMSDPHT